VSPTIKLNNKRDTTNTYSDTEHLTTDGRILKWFLEKQDGLTQNRDQCLPLQNTEANFSATPSAEFPN